MVMLNENGCVTHDCKYCKHRRLVYFSLRSEDEFKLSCGRRSSTSGKLHLKPLIVLPEMKKLWLDLNQRSWLESTVNDIVDPISRMTVRNVDNESEVL